jgi:EAL domain-containing protein (putative c-di-GMP-specific phosphodiesterase class I)/GGDEF domain-containing protein
MLPRSLTATPVAQIGVEPVQPSVAALIARGGLRAVFQPIVRFVTGEIIGYEGLIRGPAHTSLECPAALFAHADREGSAIALERAAGLVCLETFARYDCAGLLFLNYSAAAIESMVAERASMLAMLDAAGIAPARVVIELTEQSLIADVDRFLRTVCDLREVGAYFALDDYGSANASMNLWVRLQPHFVKIDRFFIQDIARHSLKFEAVKAMLSFAKASGAELIAEGIETLADLAIVRDLGINCGQGFLFGMPDPVLHAQVPEVVKATLGSAQIAVYPEPTRAGHAQATQTLIAGRMLISAPALAPRASNNDALELFNRLPSLHALAIVDGGRPVALLNRRAFMDRYALPYHRELFGKKPCLVFANGAPLMIDRLATLEEMARLLTSDDQRYLADGFVIVDNGQYAGLGTGESLVRAVTEVRIEAARYANPLTFLPGNIPISSHIERLIERRAEFHACHVDLNDFKPFNDQYGYWQGDEVLKTAAALLAEVCEPTRDFLGHIGGDDFLILFQSADWAARSQRAIARFNHDVLRFYAEQDRLAGGIHGEDRKGNPTFFGFVTMAVGAVRVAPGSAHSSDEIGSAAAGAKRRAKHEPDGFFVLDLD